VVADFSTVSMMRETPEIVGNFVDYYRRAGARQILIYYDGTAPEMRIDHPAEIVECNEAFWAERGGRPKALEDRQAMVYLAGLERCRSPWMLVADADEFVFGNLRVPDFLDRVPDEVDAVRLPTAEAVWGPGDTLGASFGATYFRTAWPRGRVGRLLRRAIYGKVAALMPNGLAGHRRGKEFIRTGRGIDGIGNHTASRDGRLVTVDVDRLDRKLQGMYLGHFDSVGRAHWERKWRMRAEERTHSVNMARLRLAQMGLFLGSMERGERAITDLFARYYSLTRLQYLALSALGRAFRRKIFVREREREPAPPSADQAGLLRTSPTMS
jgi:hypothetical protein